jgi:hypothetical protein
LKEAVAAARAREREVEMAGVTRLLESIRGLDGASSLSEVLDALALASAREAARAAVVVLRGERIHGWKMSGLGRDMQPKSIDLALAGSGVIGCRGCGARGDHAMVSAGVPARDPAGRPHGPALSAAASDAIGLLNTLNGLKRRAKWWPK